MKGELLWLAYLLILQILCKKEPRNTKISFQILYLFKLLCIGGRRYLKFVLPLCLIAICLFELISSRHVVYYLFTFFYYTFPTYDFSYPLCDVADQGKNVCWTFKYYCCYCGYLDFVSLSLLIAAVHSIDIAFSKQRIISYATFWLQGEGT